MSVQRRKDTGPWRFKVAIKQADQTIIIRKTLPKDISERRASNMDKALVSAIKYLDFRYLDQETRRVCIDIFRDQNWTLPPALINSVGNNGSAEELNLLRAIEYTMDDPEVLETVDPSRYQFSFAHILSHWGKDFPITDLKARQIKEYMLQRKEQGAAGSTINKERQALSKMFKILREARIVDRNPVEDTAPADERPGQRDVYIACHDFIRIVEKCTEWSQPIFEILYLTGMRRGEVLGLTWDKVNLKTRIISLDYGDTKERREKRVPIHKILARLLEEIKQSQSSPNDRVFLNPDGSIPHEDSLTRCWRTAVKAAGFDPKPTVHDSHSAPIGMTLC